MSALIQYDQLTDFQKWLFFYVVKHGIVRRDLRGVMRDMCMTVKMKISVDDFEKEEEKLKGQAMQLYEQKLLDVSTNQAASDSYVLSDKGELYIVQKIIKPLYDAKMKGDIIQIRNYFKTDAEKQLLSELYTIMNTQDPRASLLKISEIVLRLAMPAIQIFNILFEQSHKPA